MSMQESFGFHRFNDYCNVDQEEVSRGLDRLSKMTEQLKAPMDRVQGVVYYNSDIDSEWDEIKAVTTPIADKVSQGETYIQMSQKEFSLCGRIMEATSDLGEYMHSPIEGQLREFIHQFLPRYKQLWNGIKFLGGDPGTFLQCRDVMLFNAECLLKRATYGYHWQHLEQIQKIPNIEPAENDFSQYSLFRFSFSEPGGPAEEKRILRFSSVDSLLGSEVSTHLEPIPCGQVFKETYVVWDSKSNSYIHFDREGSLKDHLIEVLQAPRWAR